MFCFFFNSFFLTRLNIFSLSNYFFLLLLRSSIQTNVGDGGGGKIECPGGQVLAFGFGVQWTPYASGTPSSRRCVLDNNRACNIGASSCEQILCRSSTGNIENRVRSNYNILLVFNFFFGL